MQSFFRALERAGVEFLLISGQAAVLYGASTFSEDCDLWVRPTRGNLTALRRALQERGARIYKLTPPLRLDLARRGHGFHFTLPGAALPYLDVMLNPPRVGGFARAMARSQRLETPWGSMPVVGVPDLVLLKRTRRLSDYEVISNLVRLTLLRTEVPSPRLWRWALQNTFRVEDVQEWLPRIHARTLASIERPGIRALAAPGTDPAAARAAFAADLARLQSDDIAYWAPIVEELRQLRREGQLLEIGAAVT